MRIKKGDTVLIISGKDRGKKSKVLKTLPKDFKIVVEGANITKKHRRPRKSGEKGQKVEIQAPMDVSNVKLVCPKCGKPVRVGYKFVGEKKLRVCKECGEET